MFHLTARVAWHDNEWNGCVCREPSRNSFCVALDRIRGERDDDAEDAVAGQAWSELSVDQLPVCKAESGAFMNPHEWIREFRHPYKDVKKAADTHGHLQPTKVKVPAYSTFAVPFAWMLRSEQDKIDEALAESLPPDDEPPFNSAWVFSRARQEALLDLFFGRLTQEQSLIFFYCKEGQPLGDSISRLVVGVGRLRKIAPLPWYDVPRGKASYPMWDRLVRHSIRPDGEDGFILPYHKYLKPTGDPEEDERRLTLLREIAVSADHSHIRAFSYAAELAAPDIALSSLIRCLESVQKIREHGIAPGSWETQEDWLNAKIAEVWEDRGAFPGLGAALEALGLRMGTSLTFDLLGSGQLSPDDDPWPLVDSLLRGKIQPPKPSYVGDLAPVGRTWTNLPEERRSLLQLLSRFAFTPGQAIRWFDPAERSKATSESVTDLQILENPYRMVETDLGDQRERAVPLGMIDRGLLPESRIAAAHPVPAPSHVASPNDPRRIRAGLVTVLREAAEEGDSLLSVPEALMKAAQLDLARPLQVGSDWPSTNAATLDGMVDLLDVQLGGEEHRSVAALQLSELTEAERKLAGILLGRAKKVLPSIQVEWSKLLTAAIAEAGGTFDPRNDKHNRALVEQAAALDRIAGRRLSVLVGRAGTGKTSVMGAVMRCDALAKGGILLLAPTGKARVRLGRAANAEAMTVAQFLYSLRRFDGVRQRPLFHGTEKHRKERTVVIDECSMLTTRDLLAVLLALDLAHVQRLILVGDPNQLPPIGVGRPFADLVAFLEAPGKDDSLDGDEASLAGALARLTVEVRTVEELGASDALRLASWFTREQQPVDADRVLSDLETGQAFKDLEILFWKTPEDLREKLEDAFHRHLGIISPTDIAGFDASLGFDEKGWVPFDSPNGSENWQILSPVKMQSHGVHDLNRWVQRRFRGPQLQRGLEPWGLGLGDETIVKKDKIIQITNQWRSAYDGSKTADHYIANGEVGLVALEKYPWLNVVFADRPNLTFGYRGRDFPGGSGPLELAYALTVHKAQGSEFRKVFVVIPQRCRLLSRELLYTALTRSRVHLVLLIEGDDPSVLFDLSRPERSETARRNTNLFRGAIRAEDDGIPYAEHLIHKTEKGHLVRSKSELVIANMLFQHGVEYDYERVCEGEMEPGRLRPDFSFTTAGGDLVIWEHLGMMNRPDYKQGWEWKLNWYRKNGYVSGRTLFSSEEDAHGGLDSGVLRSITLQIKDLLE